MADCQITIVNNLSILHPICIFDVRGAGVGHVRVAGRAETISPMLAEAAEARLVTTDRSRVVHSPARVVGPEKAVVVVVSPVW